MATVFSIFRASRRFSSVTSRSKVSATATKTSKVGKTCLPPPVRGKSNLKSNTRSNNVLKPPVLKNRTDNPNPNPRFPSPLPAQSKSSGDQVDKFIALWEALIESRNRTIAEAKRKYTPYSEEWAESFYHIKGKHTRATCFSQDQLPALVTNLINSDCKRDFVLYKDIPTMVVISDFTQNFGSKELPEVDHLEYEPISLSPHAPLPKGYQSVLLDEEGKSLPRGYHIILDSSSLRILSHVTKRELFQSWKLDPREREKQVRTIYRRNKWPFTEKV